MADPIMAALAQLAGPGGGGPPGIPPGMPPGMSPGMGGPPGMPPMGMPGMMPSMPQMPPPQMGPPPGAPPFLQQSGNMPSDLLDHGIGMIQMSLQLMNPANELADRLAGVLRDLMGISAQMKGIPQALGPRRTPHGLGVGPEGNNPLMRGLPDVPPPPPPGRFQPPSSPLGGGVEAGQLPDEMM